MSSKIRKYGRSIQILYRQNGKPYKKLQEKGHTTRPSAIKKNAYGDPKTHAVTCSSVTGDRSLMLSYRNLGNFKSHRKVGLVGPFSNRWKAQLSRSLALSHGDPSKQPENGGLGQNHPSEGKLEFFYQGSIEDTD